MNKFQVDFDKLNQEAEKMNASGSGDYLSQKDIKEGGEIDLRIVPPLPSLGGLYYLKVHSVWINNINYISPRTFNRPCPILDLCDEIHKGTDEDLKAMITAEGFSVREEYVLPVFQLNPVYKGNRLEDVEIVGKGIKIFRCTFSVIRGISNVMNSRHYQNDSPLGIMDIEVGHNITISKHIKGKQTSYEVQGWPKPYAMDESLYDEVPDIVDKYEKKVYQDDYLVGVMNNYLYGEDMPDDSLKFKKTTTPAAKKTANVKESKETKTMSLAERLAARRNQ